MEGSVWGPPQTKNEYFTRQVLQDFCISFWVIFVSVSKNENDLSTSNYLLMMQLKAPDETRHPCISVWEPCVDFLTFFLFFNFFLRVLDINRLF